MEFFICIVLALSVQAPAIQGKSSLNVNLLYFAPGVVARVYMAFCARSYASLQNIGSPVVLQSPRLIELPVGGVLRLNCSSSSTYVVEFIEIGQPITIEQEIAYNIEQEGNPRVHYSQEGCQHNDPPEIACIKTLEMDVVESLHGKSFQCRARTRYLNHVTYYSEGSYLHGRLKMLLV